MEQIFIFIASRWHLTLQLAGLGLEVIDKIRSVPFFHSVLLGVAKKSAMSGVKKADCDARLKSSSKL